MAGLFCPMKLTRKAFFYLALITLFGFGALGYAVIELFHDYSFLDLMTSGYSWDYQLFRGAIFGAIAGLNLLWLVETPLLATPREFFKDLVREANLQWPDLLFLSFAAGVGEEIFFRGTIQPWLGIWLTAIVFVALHGYLNPGSWRMSIYGILMVIVSAGLGYLFEYVGIYAAMTAHFMVDAILFIRFRYYG